MKKIAGCVIWGILLLCTAAFLYFLFRFAVLPGWIFALVAVALIGIATVEGFFLLRKKSRISFGIAIFFAVLLSVGMGFASYQMYRTTRTVEEITTPNEEYTEISVFVKKEAKAEDIKDVKDWTFGIYGGGFANGVTLITDELQKEAGTTLQVTPFEDVAGLVDAIDQWEVQVIALDENYLEILKGALAEDSGVSYEDKISGLRKLKGYRIKSSLFEVAVQKPQEPEPVATEPAAPSTEQTEQKEQTEQTEQTEVVEPPKLKMSAPEGVYTVYISGIDTYGEVSKRSRSDVNIIAIVNTKTNRIQLISTPRDYYIPTTVSHGIKDKLTHAGIYGINCSIGTLSDYYGLQIDYYVRMNFSGFENIIDALGGVTVVSDYNFNAGPYTYVKGNNYLNGKQALAFARERYAFASGDIQRGKDQMKVIQAVVQKCISPAILSNYDRLLDSLKGSFETNMPFEQIMGIVQMKVENPDAFQVDTYTVTGFNSDNYTYSMPRTRAYVMIPNEKDVAYARELMKQALYE